MIETARIKSLNGNRAVLVCGDSAACEGCGGSGFCNVQERTYEGIIQKGLEVVEGDVVKVFLPGGQTVFSAFLVMIVPLLLFMAGFMIAGRLFGIESEGVRVLFGMIGLAGGFLLSYLYSRARSISTKGMPKIVEKA